MEITPDDFAFHVALNVIAEVELELRRTTAPVLDAGVVPGGPPPVEAINCKAAGNGLAWSRVTSVYGSTSFPDPEAVFDFAGTGRMLAAVLEVGVARCAPIGTSTRPPTMEDYTTSANLQLADMRAVRSAICRVLLRLELPWVLGTYTPTTLEGGVVGGAWSFTVGQD